MAQAGPLASISGLGGNQRRKAMLAQPALQPGNLPETHPVVVGGLQQLVQCVEDNCRGADPDRPVLKHGKQTRNIELAGADDVEVGLGVDEDQPLGTQGLLVPGKRLRVSQYLLGRLLEGNKDAGLAPRARSLHQGLQHEYGLAGARTALDKGGPAHGKPTPGCLVKADDSCSCLAQSHIHLTFHFMRQYKAKRTASPQGARWAPPWQA